MVVQAGQEKRAGHAWILWSSCLAMLAVGANGTAIMAALPSMRAELLLSSAGVEWAINAYLVASAACIVLGGQAADRFGATKASIVGLVLFGIASCIIALADTQTTLLAGPCRAWARRSRCLPRSPRSAPAHPLSKGRPPWPLGPGS